LTEFYGSKGLRINTTGWQHKFWNVFRGR